MSTADDQASMAAPPGGLANALRFLAASRSDPELRSQIAGLEPEAGLRPVVLLAAEAGFSVTVDDLRAAFSYDWGLRRAHYLRNEAPADKAATTVAVVHTPRSGM
jgi:hypothetical protein